MKHSKKKKELFNRIDACDNGFDMQVAYALMLINMRWKNKSVHDTAIEFYNKTNKIVWG